MGATINNPRHYPKIAFILLVIAFLFHLIAIAAPHWSSTDLSQTDLSEHVGLWKFCTYPVGGGEACGDFVDIIYGDWLKAAQSFMILSLFVIPAALGIVAMYAFGKEDDMRVIGAAMALTAVGGLFTLITVATWGDKHQDFFNRQQPGMWENVGVLDWAFGLACTDCILSFLALGFLVASVAERNTIN